MGEICRGILKSISNLNSNQDYGVMEAVEPLRKIIQAQKREILIYLEIKTFLIYYSQHNDHSLNFYCLHFSVHTC